MTLNFHSESFCFYPQLRGRRHHTQFMYFWGLNPGSLATVANTVPPELLRRVLGLYKEITRGSGWDALNTVLGTWETSSPNSFWRPVYWFGTKDTFTEAKSLVTPFSRPLLPRELPAPHRITRFNTHPGSLALINSGELIKKWNLF